MNMNFKFIRLIDIVSYGVITIGTPLGKNQRQVNVYSIETVYE